MARGSDKDTMTWTLKKQCIQVNQTRKSTVNLAKADFSISKLVPDSSLMYDQAVGPRNRATTNKANSSCLNWAEVTCWDRPLRMFWRVQDLKTSRIFQPTSRMRIRGSFICACNTSANTTRSPVLPISAQFIPRSRIWSRLRKLQQPLCQPKITYTPNTSSSL